MEEQTDSAVGTVKYYIYCKGCQWNKEIKHKNTFKYLEKYWFICSDCCYGTQFSKYDVPKSFGLKTVCHLIPLHPIPPRNNV